MIKVPFYRRFDFRIVALAALLILISSVVGLVTTRYVVEKDFRALLFRQFHTTGNMAENAFNQMGQMALNGANHFLHHKALYSAVDADNSAAIIAQMDKLTKEAKADVVVLLNPQGRVVYHSKDPGQIGKSRMSQRIVREAIFEGKVGTSILQEMDNFIIYSSGRMVEEDDNSPLKAIILLGFAINDRLIKNITKNTDMGLTLVRRRAIMGSTFNRDGRRLKSLPMQWASYQSMLKNPEVIGRLLFNGTSYFTYAHRLRLMDPLQEGSILFTVSTRHHDEVRSELLQKFTLPFLIQFLLISFLGWIFAQRLLKPLNQLVLFTRKSSQQQQPLKIEQNDEVGVLAQYFNELISNAQQKTHDLELRVEERTHELRISTEHAETANQAKSEFLSSMSHELRTPLNAILGFSQILEYDTSLSDEHQDSVQEIIKGGQHLLSLINEVLDLAKVEAGHIALSMEMVELDNIIDDCLALTAVLADKREIKLSRGAGGYSALIWADHIRIKQALINLISNAIKYNHHGGSVRIDVEPKGEERLRIIVIDTGPGIPQERMSELFQPFHRLAAEGSEIEGTGIGLTLTKRIVELMGGEVGVESEVGVGSRFWIELPLKAASVEQQQLAEEAAGEGKMRDNLLLDKAEGMVKNRQYTVLYIEDNPVNLRLVEKLIGHRREIHLLTAHIAELGLELAQVHRPDLILLDINLPGMDGYQMLTVLKESPDLREIPVIAISAMAMKRDIERGQDAGFSEYLTKPLDVTRFMEMLDQYLG